MDSRNRYNDWICCLLISLFFNKANIMYKVNNNLAPNYLQEFFHVRDVNFNNTASNLKSVAQNNYIVPQAKCNLLKGSLTFSGIIVWNRIPLSIKMSPSLDIFVKIRINWIKKIAHKEF